jgi:hypothetical protein
MLFLFLIAPPAAVAPAVQPLPPLSFIGFRARMSVADAEALTKAAGGSLACKPASDARIRECQGTFPFYGLTSPFSVLISSVNDSAAVIVLSHQRPGNVADRWASALTLDFGTPNRNREQGVQMTWEWIRRGQMLRLVERKVEDHMEVAVTLTDGPLLDSLGPAKRKRPN